MHPGPSGDMCLGRLLDQYLQLSDPPSESEPVIHALRTATLGCGKRSLWSLHGDGTEQVPSSGLTWKQRLNYFKQCVLAFDYDPKDDTQTQLMYTVESDSIRYDIRFSSELLWLFYLPLVLWIERPMGDFSAATVSVWGG